MTTGRLVGAFACGLVVGLALASIPYFAARLRASDGRAQAELLDADALARARVHEIFDEDPPHIELQHSAPIDPAGAWTLGTPRDFAHEPHFEAIPVETRNGLVAFKAWEGDGFTGQIATICFGPERDDVRVRVGAFSDAGLPGDVPWNYVHGRIQLSTWPPNRPGALIAFEFEGQLKERVLAFSGKIRIPPTGSHEEDLLKNGPRLRVLVDAAPQPPPESTNRGEGIEAHVERMPARGGLQAFRYRETDHFGGVQVTFSFGPAREDVQARVDDLSDAGDPEAWSALHGTIWLPPTPLDRPGSLVEFELFGMYRGGPRRFAARFVTPP